MPGRSRICCGTCLVNAAGGNMPGASAGPGQNLFDIGIEDTRRAIDLNLFGIVIPTTVFGRVMADQGSRATVNISLLTAQPFSPGC